MKPGLYLGLAAGLLGALLPAAYACDVPVHEYALTNWTRDTYRVYYIHNGKGDPADDAANAVLRAAASATTPPTNIAFAAISSREQLPEELAGARGALAAARLPVHVVLTPRLKALAIQRLDEAEAKALVDSPGRQALAKALCGPNMGVLLLLADASEAAASARDIVRRVASREIGGCGFVEIDRNAVAERWLVRQLLSLEDDLPALAGPMAFAVFGRGHAMEPFVGRGISEDNMAELVAFMAGPCTCEVKEEHLGMDLLTRWDWEQYAIPGAVVERPMEPTGFVTLDE